MNDRILREQEEEKDVGVVVHSSLKPSRQCSEAVKKANRVIGMIKRSFSSQTKDILLRLYKQFVRPHLEYAVQAWSPWLTKDIQLLEKVQRRFTKLIIECRGKSYNERLSLLHLTTLETRRVRGDMIQVYKIINNFDECSVNLEPCLVKSTRGHTGKLQKKFAKLDVRKYSFSVRVVDEWNALPEYVVCSKDVNTFKNNIDNHFCSIARI